MQKLLTHQSFTLAGCLVDVWRQSKRISAILSNASLFKNKSFELDHYGKQRQFLALDGYEQSEEGEVDDVEDKREGNHDLIRNLSLETV